MIGRTNLVRPAAWLVSLFVALGLLVAVPAYADEPTGSISGQMTFPGGLPVAGGNVVVQQRTYPGGMTHDWPIATVTTKGDGTYTVAGLPVGEYRVWFAAGDGEWAEEWWEDSLTLQGSTPIQLGDGQVRTGVDAELVPMAQVSITVRDRRGDPLFNVYMNADYQDGLGGTLGRTDVHGRFTSTLRPIPVTLFLAGNQHDLLSQQRSLDPQPGETINLDVTLPDLSRITGVVTDFEGRPVPGVCAEPISNTSIASWNGDGECSDSEGRFVIDGLEPGSEWTVMFRPPTPYLTEFWQDERGWETADTFAVGLEETVVKDATIAEEGVVTGRLTSASGKPLAGVVAIFHGQDEHGSPVRRYSTPSDADGVYRVDRLWAGGYRLHFVRHPYFGRVDEWSGGGQDPATAEQVPVVRGQTTTYDAVLTAGTPEQNPPAPAPSVTVEERPRLIGRARATKVLALSPGRYLPGDVTTRIEWFVGGRRVVLTDGLKLKLRKRWVGRQVFATVVVSRTGYPTLRTSSQVKTISAARAARTEAAS